MISKRVSSVSKALEGISDGMTLMLGGFGLCGIPENAIAELVRLEIKDLTCIYYNYYMILKCHLNCHLKHL